MRVIIYLDLFWGPSFSGAPMGLLPLIGGSSLCVCHYDKSPAVWCPYWAPGFLETATYSSYGHKKAQSQLQKVACLPREFSTLKFSSIP